MESVKITLHEGTQVTWRRQKDGLADIDVSPSGALLVFISPTPGIKIIKHAYSIGLWIEVDVEYAS